MKYYINIGTNLGNRRLNLSRAVAAVERRFGYFEISKVVESEPWGYDSTNLYLNVAMMFDTEEAPLDVLHALQAIEKEISPEAHRNPDGTYKDRLIDIDIMAIENVVVDEPELKVPHPHLFDRPFFINPLKELLGKDKED
ncbi:MAG: 2-amino-4-hydroxy-6-hydroxymethyldihydropteridine diphosphokinase [Muribaculaceae bacterium]|nr:2-amino-4-hydroxy-6-hydroxymethyldihydropteridine diphosphokinase [Muribaculaceae bacterium]